MCRIFEYYQEIFPKQIAFGELYASDGCMKLALYIYKSVPFAEELKEKKEKTQEIAIKFCLTHFSQPYFGFTPTFVGKMAELMLL
jgi:hypothetical protein